MAALPALISINHSVQRQVPLINFGFIAPNASSLEGRESVGASTAQGPHRMPPAGDKDQVTPEHPLPFERPSKTSVRGLDPVEAQAANHAWPCSRWLSSHPARSPTAVGNDSSNSWAPGSLPGLNSRYGTPPGQIRMPQRRIPDGRNSRSAVITARTLPAHIELSPIWSGAHRCGGAIRCCQSPSPLPPPRGTRKDCKRHTSRSCAIQHLGQREVGASKVPAFRERSGVTFRLRTAACRAIPSRRSDSWAYRRLNFSGTAFSSLKLAAA
jgi:hypothetical protein